jgi:hypothetical protein
VACLCHSFFLNCAPQYLLSTVYQPPFNQWQIQDVALSAISSSRDGGDGVYYWGRVVLDRALFPPYVPRKALHSKSFPVIDACTYIFCRNSSNKNSCSSNTTKTSHRGLNADVVNLDLVDGDDDASSAATLVPVTRPLILFLRKLLLQSITISPSREKGAKSKSKRKRKKRRTN